jgi:hypothetical protein
MLFICSLILVSLQSHYLLMLKKEVEVSDLLFVCLGKFGAAFAAETGARGVFSSTFGADFQS